VYHFGRSCLIPDSGKWGFGIRKHETIATAGLRQPLLVHGIGRLKNNDIHGAQTHISKSGGRQPAVGTKRNCNGAGFFSGTSTFAHHGWLTPAAPGARRRSAEK
jgi:hypothetical protein